MYAFKLYLSLLKIHIKAQTSYKKSFLVEIVAYFLQMSLHICGICFIFYHVQTIAGWSIWEILYLYGITSTAFSAAQLLGEKFEDLPVYIKSGQFDQMLTRPVSPLIQIAALSFRIERVGSFVQSIAVLFLACLKTKIHLTVANLGLITTSVIFLFTVYYALFLASGALSFWNLDSNEIFNAFTYGGIEVSKYPICIYKEWMQTLFIYMIPIGVASYLPAVQIYNKPSQLLIWTPELLYAPVIIFCFLGLIVACWRFSLRRYQSTGS